jgi:hypothetical protein
MAQVSSVMSYSAPVKGWNASSALASMKPDEAIVLNNWFPRPSYCEIRGGFASHATGMTGNGKTLVTYNAMSGANKMFCSTASGVYDVTNPGAVGASVAARTNGKHQWTMFGDATNSWLIMCNGVDKPLYYDGSTWTAVDGGTSPALTGLTTTEIIGATVYKGRLLFLQKNSLSFWYLAAGAAGGALTEFDMSGEAKKGGYLMAIATWTRDAGDGQDDVAVFITSEGEALVYQGNNPSSLTTWAKVGTFFIGKPLGRRCVTQFGGDLVVITQNGTFPLSAALQSAAIDYKLALSFKIEDAFTEAARNYGSNFGWEAIVYPAQSALLVNIPISEDGEHQQYVMNTTTKAWCKFTDWDAEDFAILNGQLYFCDGTAVNKAWSGTSDGPDEIVAYAKTAFSYFNSPGQNKQFKMFRPVFAANGTFTFLTDIDVDFNDEEISGTATYTVQAGATWDVSNWDESYWATNLEVLKEWTSPAEWEGYCAAGKIKIQTSSLTIQWMSNDFMHERGGNF